MDYKRVKKEDMKFDLKQFIIENNLSAQRIALLFCCTRANVYFKIKNKKVSIEEYDLLDAYKEKRKKNKE